MRHILILGLTLFTIGCSVADPSPTTSALALEYEASTVQCVFNRMEPGWEIGSLASGFAIGPEDRFIVSVPDQILYANGWVPALSQAPVKPFAFTLDSDGALLLVSGSAFGVVVDEELVKLTELPATGFHVAAGEGDLIYLFGQVTSGKTVVFLLDKPSEVETTVRQLFAIDGVISSVVAVDTDILFAVDRDVFRAGPTSDSEWGTMRAATIPNGEIVSLAFDSARKVLFVSTNDSTMMIYNNMLLPILSFGGEIALGGPDGEWLFVYQSVEGRAFKVDLPNLLTDLSTE